MNILIINGSPSGDDSITLQTMRYIGESFPEHHYELLNVGKKIRTFERNFSAAAQALERFIRSGQIDRVRLLTERGLADAEASAGALKIAPELGETAICAVLMESGRESAGKNQDLELELEDW